ncbi:hypothetical protein ISS05_03830, partial [Candidatus Woesearchaeota archaeon]|nr:hypothetical protein [Candidatus Woesearchaeota archaeon]
MSKKGWIVDYDSTQKIECCEEEPFTMAAAKAVPSCPNHKNLIKHERIIFDEKRGEPVRVITVICSN